MQWLASQPGVYYVEGPMCHWHMTSTDAQGEALVKKETGWLTNSYELANLLNVQCSNMLSDKSCWHRHVHLVNGRAKIAEQYPPKLIRAILRCLKNIILSRGQISAVELMHGGPTAELPEVWQDPAYVEYYDGVNGGLLPTGETEKARKLEIDWILKEKLCDYVPRSEADKEGIKPIPLLWIDTNKGDSKNIAIRSRLVVRERTKGKNARPALAPEQLLKVA